MFELCEVTLNPKQQSLVQRQTEQWKGKIKFTNKSNCMQVINVTNAFKLFFLSMSEMLLLPS